MLILTFLTSSPCDFVFPFSLLLGFRHQLGLNMLVVTSFFLLVSLIINK